MRYDDTKRLGMISFYYMFMYNKDVVQNLKRQFKETADALTTI